MLLLNAIDQPLKGIWFVHREVSKDFAVEADAFLAQLVDENGVGKTFGADGGVDTGDPQRAVFSLFQFAAYITILKTLLQYVLGYGVYIFTFAVKSFCLFKDAFPASPGSDGVD